MPFACIYVPDFIVEAILRSSPQPALLRERAVAVFDGEPPLVTIVAANERARLCGIELGMPKLDAEGCHDTAGAAVLLRKRSSAQEAAAHAALLDCARSFSPRVEALTPEIVLADLAGLEPLFGAPPRIARDLARKVSEAGLEAHVAVAADPDTALLAARGFPGVTIVPAGREAERLGALPIDVLHAAPEVLETLDRWGVRTLRAFAVLPPVPVVERLGQEGLRLQKMARGELRRTLVPVSDRLVFEESCEFEDALDSLEPLAFSLSRLLDCLCQRLTARALATNELRIECGLEFHPDVQLREAGEATNATASDVVIARSAAPAEPERYRRKLRLPVPMNDSKLFLKLLQLELRAHPPEATVKWICLGAEPVPPRAAQSGLFAPAAPQPEALELTLARVSALVSDKDGQLVGSPEVLDTHRPDAFRMEKFLPTRFATGAASATAASTAPSDSPLAALRMLRPPLKIAVELRNAVPARLFINRDEQRSAGFAQQRVVAEVVHAAGPWRSSGEWWADAWSREEWDIAATAAGQPVLYRIFRDVTNGDWFLQGVYD